MKLDGSYLKRSSSFEEVERRCDFRNAAPEFREDWERLKAKSMPGDELWDFEPPPGSIRMWGVALVRAGEVVSTLIEAVG